MVIRWCCGHTSICVSRVYAFSFGDVGSRIFQLMVSQECASPPSCPAFGSCPPPGALPCPCPVSVAMDLNFSDSDDSAEDVVEAMPQTSGEQEPWAEGAIRELKQQPCSQGVHEDGDAWKLQRTHAASEADRLTKTQSSAYGRMEQQAAPCPTRRSHQCCRRLAWGRASRWGRRQMRTRGRPGLHRSSWQTNEARSSITCLRPIRTLRCR